MIKKTNLEAVKEVAVSFLHFAVDETPLSPLIVNHPIFETGIVDLKNGNECKMTDILTPDGFAEATEQYEQIINACENAYHVFLVVRKSYRLTFLKFTEPYLSLEDFSNILAYAWVSSENPNQYTNCNLRLLIKWFKKADKRTLMEDTDYAIYTNLPDEFTVYRGVGVGRNPKGLSWTRSYNKAVWFANRFNRDGKTGYVQGAVIKRDKVLAYFNTRNEDEIVANSKDLSNFKIIE